MNRLYLVGTNHEDPKGPSRLERIFDWTRPSMITVESDAERTAMALKQHADYERRGQQVEDMFAILYGTERLDYFRQVMNASLFDQWMPSTYGSKHHVPVRLVDDISHMGAEAAGLWNAHYERTLGTSTNIGEAFLKRLTSCDPIAVQAEHDAVYDVTAVHGTVDAPLYFKLCARRETNMEEHIRKAAHETDGNLVHIGGNLHIFGEHYNLYDRLKDLEPIRIKLRDADSF